MYLLLSFAAQLLKCAYIIAIYFMFENDSYDYMVVLSALSVVLSIVFTLSFDLHNEREISELNDKVNQILLALDICTRTLNRDQAE
jgi:hypothetical protein